MYSSSMNKDCYYSYYLLKYLEYGCCDIDLAQNLMQI